MAIPVIFFGTSAFAIPSLQALAKDARFEVRAVVTQPDRPVGRHAVPTPPPIKETAVQLGLPVLQFEKVKTPEALDALRAIDAEVGVVVSFGQILPQSLLDLFPKGVLNVHGSLLPAYRGASPIQAAILGGETETGVTIMQVDAALDHGPILTTAREPILETDTGGALHDRLAALGGVVLPDALFAYTQGTLLPIAQDHAQATTTTLLSREHGAIDLHRTAAELARMVRAYTPWPGTTILRDGKRIKIHAAHAGTDPSTLPIGSALIVEGAPALVCGNGTVLVLDRLQPEGKNAMDGVSFLRGNSWN